MPPEIKKRVDEPLEQNNCWLLKISYQQNRNYFFTDSSPSILFFGFLLLIKGAEFSKSVNKESTLKKSHSCIVMSCNKGLNDLEVLVVDGEVYFTPTCNTLYVKCNKYRMVLYVLL